MPTHQFLARYGTLVSNNAPPLKEWLLLPNVYHEVAAVIGWHHAINFGMAVFEKKRPPSRAKTDRVHGGGVGVIYVPATISAHSGSDLVSLAGIGAAALLVKAFPRKQLEFPCIIAASIPRRNRAIADQVLEGWPVSTVAAIFDLEERRIRSICKQEGVSPKSSMPAMRALRRERRAQVRAAVATGAPFVDVADEYGFTLEAVLQICEAPA